MSNSRIWKFLLYRDTYKENEDRNEKKDLKGEYEIKKQELE